MDKCPTINEGQLMLKYITALLILLSVSAFADSTVFSGSTYIEDTYISNIMSDTNVNMSSRDTLRHYDYSNFSYFQSPIIKLKNIDDSIDYNHVTIDSAAIYLYQITDIIYADSIYVKGKLCKNVIISQATHNIYKTGSNWNTAGGRAVDGTACNDCWHSGTYDIVGESGRKVQTISAGWQRFQVPQCHADSFVKYPDSANTIALWGGTVVNKYFKAWSTEKGSNIPKFVIYWTEKVGGYPAGVGHYPGGVGVGHSPSGATEGHKP